MSNPLDGFPVVIELDVRWGDQDALGHVNNTVFFQYMESARMAFFEAVTFTGGQGGGVGPILHSATCRFRRPLTYPDKLKVGARVSTMDGDRFRMEYVVVSGTQQAVAAEGTGLVVAFDYSTGTKTQVPDAVKEKIRALGG